MNSFNVAAKSFIVNKDNKLLLIKRRPNDVHKPNVWEIPGGRLDESESPYEGVKRETIEETGLEITVLNPLRIHHFEREDEQQITLITFLCKPKSTDVELSEEHTEYDWFDLEEAKDKITVYFREEINVFQKLFEEHYPEMNDEYARNIKG